MAEEEEDGQESGLLVELEGKDEKKKRETDLWFSKVSFIFWATVTQTGVKQLFGLLHLIYTVTHKLTA